MTTTNIKLPYLEDTGLDGKKLYTPREWTERFRHNESFRKNPQRGYQGNINGRYGATGDTWDTKEPEIRQKFIRSAGASAIAIITKGEFNTDPDTIKTEKLIQLFRKYYMPKRNTYHSRGVFFGAKQEKNETPEEHWKKLITLEKNATSKC